MSTSTKTTTSIAKFSLQEPDDKSQGSLESGESNEIETEWKPIIIAGLITFIAAVENTVVGMSEWAYLTELDKNATAQFFGFATGLSKAFHALSALFFAIWCYRYQTFRVPLIAGRIIAFLGCAIYLCVELVEHEKRYSMAFCYILFGIGASSSSILRAYVAALSSCEHRPRAYSIIQLANMLSIIVGPVIQAIFSGIDYPGIAILPFLPNLRFHLYSAPVWVAALTNFVSIALILGLLQELPKRAKNTMEKEKSMLTLEGMKKRITTIKNMEMNWPIVVLCWAMKMATTVTIVTLLTLTSVLIISDYGWERDKSVLAISITMISVGVLSLALVAVYQVTELGRRVPLRISFLIAMLSFVSMYLFSYPWNFISLKVAPYDNVRDIGCNSTVYSWCTDGYAPNPYFLLTVIALVLGVAIPLAGISSDAIYSKCLGNINQSVMQGAMVVAEDIVLIFGPIYASSVFTHFGIGAVWMINGCIMALGSIVWIAFWSKLGRYS